MNNQTEETREETREERIKRHMANSARARLLGAEVCVPVFKLKRGGSYYYPTGFASIKMSAIVAHETTDMEIHGEDMDGSYTAEVHQIMLEGGHVLFTNEAGRHAIYLLQVHGEYTSMNMNKPTNKNLQESLKNCPFCGGWSDFGIDESGGVCVVCNTCFASGECLESERTALKAWNKRENEA